MKRNIGVMVEENDFEIIRKSAEMQRRSMASIIAQGGIELARKIIQEANNGNSSD